MARINGSILLIALPVSHIPAIGSLFSAFLGINPIKTLLGAKVLAEPGVHASVLLGRGFFPGLISAPFAHGLHLAFLAAAGMCLLGAVVSWLRGPNPVHPLHSPALEAEEGLADVAEVASMAQTGTGATVAVSEASAES